MASNTNDSDINIEKNSKITVNVDEVLPDIIVVTFMYGNKIFQGALLDSTKKQLPFGVSSLHPAFNADSKADKDDKLYSITQRFAYQEKPTQQPQQRRPLKSQAKMRNARMTVRLRPRQVLCSKCRGICNENSENVDNTRKRRTDGSEVNTRLAAKERRLASVSLNSPPRPLFSDSQTNNNNQQKKSNSSTDPLMCPSLIPRLSRLQPSEITNALNGNKIKVISNYRSPDHENEDPLALNNNDFLQYAKQSQEDFNEPNIINVENSTEDTDDDRTLTPRQKSKRMVLRKKKSIGSMEDLWDESVFEESAAAMAADSTSQNTRTLKISFGRQGEGTVLKIPAKIDSFDPSSDNEDNADVKVKDAKSKAARRALKKAKKEARKKILLGNGQSPCYTLGGGSPRYAMTSPRYAMSSPRHNLGNNSPRYSISASMDNALISRKHKHKVKHKKKHRDEKKHKSLSDDPLFIPETAYTAIKERCLKQKLSISLKRLNANSYTKCDNDKSPTSDASDENTPNFPPAPQPLMMHISAQTVNATGLDADGNKLEVGDVVWGKILGFPWWPGKVLSITSGDSDGNATADSPLRPQAHVAWYGSSTSSLMPCDQLSPFLENFKSRYNKKKRGPYKEAIRQATSEARNEPPTPTVALVPLVSPPLASPREIDVVS